MKNPPKLWRILFCSINRPAMIACWYFRWYLPKIQHAKRLHGAVFAVFFNSRRPTNNTPKGFQRRPRDGVFLCVYCKLPSSKVLQGGFIAFCALSDATAIAKARGLRVLLQAP
jgi:hypothetical protein